MCTRLSALAAWVWSGFTLCITYLVQLCAVEPFANQILLTELRELFVTQSPAFAHVQSLEQPSRSVFIASGVEPPSPTHWCHWKRPQIRGEV